MYFTRKNKNYLLCIYIYIYIYICVCMKKDSRFGSGDNMANRISKGTTRVAMLGVFLMFLGAPLLANTNDRCHQSLNGISGYKMLKARAKTMGNVTGHESISENVCENKVLVDAAIQSMVTIYIYI
jgi:hypothetical protein